MRSEAVGGADRDRTDDPLVANQVLSQLSYSPRRRIENRKLKIETAVLPRFQFSISPFSISGAAGELVGLGRFELPTSRLSGVRSNQLSYRPANGAACSIGSRLVSHLPQRSIVIERAKAVP
jgi:hypothetical protein